jgi:hypothetical protein
VFDDAGGIIAAKLALVDRHWSLIIGLSSHEMLP